MKLVYKLVRKSTRQPIKVGESVSDAMTGEPLIVDGWKEPMGTKDPLGSVAVHQPLNRLMKDDYTPHELDLEWDITSTD